MLDWIYASYSEKPNKDEFVLCDLGKDNNFKVLKYISNNLFIDENCTRYFLNYDENSTKNVHRWCHIGKHYNEEF